MLERYLSRLKAYCVRKDDGSWTPEVEAIVRANCTRVDVSTHPGRSDCTIWMSGHVGALRSFRGVLAFVNARVVSTGQGPAGQPGQCPGARRRLRPRRAAPRATSESESERWSEGGEGSAGSEGGKEQEQAQTCVCCNGSGMRACACSSGMCMLAAVAQWEHRLLLAEAKAAKAHADASLADARAARIMVALVNAAFRADAAESRARAFESRARAAERALEAAAAADR